ncbi:Hypothetical predicted protein [Mytilus galloprovincialis]|uniref:Uncharacterized protein n=1 Tax=Mytilus galloprovincialis TaxID=29158 RepID=A0A8B6E9F8_MYTGA|nr:Hypothetical predicted protein [Mytilus galloprovincialis]
MDPLTLPCNGCQHCSKLHKQWEKFEANVDDVLQIATRRITAIDNTDSHRTWIEGYSRMQLQEEQLKDSVTKNLMEWMKHGPPERKHIVKECHALRHYWLCFQQLSIQSQDNWDKHLYLLTGAYRSTPHTNTGLTPNRLMLGREKCHEFARKSLKKSSEHQKRLHDLRKHEHTFETGDLIYAMDTAKKIGKSPNLQAKWKGPYVVSKRLDTVLYEIGNQKTTTVLHNDRLKPAMLHSIPLWITRHRRKLKNIEADVLDIPEVETCLQEVLDDEVTDYDEVSVNNSNVTPGPRTQDPDSEGDCE